MAALISVYVTDPTGISSSYQNERPKGWIGDMPNDDDAAVHVDRPSIDHNNRATCEIGTDATDGATYQTNLRCATA
jgi:hypothetical protein